jgi:hypothetical protein
VIARPSRLGDRDVDAGDDAGEEDRALDLCARRLIRPVDRAEAAATDGHRQPVGVVEVDAGAHRFQRTGDAMHWAPAQTRIADEARDDRRGRDDAGE